MFNGWSAGNAQFPWKTKSDSLTSVIIDWSVVDLYICHSSCEWYIWNPCNFQNSGYQQSKDLKGYKIAQNSSTVTLPKRLLWSGCDESDAATWICWGQWGSEIVICRGIGVTQGQDDLWSVNFQSSPVQCGRVQRWWTRSRCCFMTPYVAATKLLSTSSWQLLSASRIWPSWLMLLDTANVDTSNLDSLLMWILLIILMWPVS